MNEAEYICEILEPDSDRPVADGERGELVVTNLGRAASPLIRYRTGDLVVRRSGPCACGRSFCALEGGILARADDMVNVRGVNVYPSAVESVVRRFRRSGGVPRHRRHHRAASRIVGGDRAEPRRRRQIGRRAPRRRRASRIARPDRPAARGRDQYAAALRAEGADGS